MRKQIDVDEALLSHNLMNKKVMNDIMYYLRKLIKLARRAQTLSLREGVNIYEDSDIQEELKNMRDVISEIESTLK